MQVVDKSNWKYGNILARSEFIAGIMFVIAGFVLFALYIIVIGPRFGIGGFVLEGQLGIGSNLIEVIILGCFVVGSLFTWHGKKRMKELKTEHNDFLL